MFQLWIISTLRYGFHVQLELYHLILIEERFSSDLIEIHHHQLYLLQNDGTFLNQGSVRNNQFKHLPHSGYGNVITSIESLASEHQKLNTIDIRCHQVNVIILSIPLLHLICLHYILDGRHRLIPTIFINLIKKK